MRKVFLITSVLVAVAVLWTAALRSRADDAPGTPATPDAAANTTVDPAVAPPVIPPSLVVPQREPRLTGVWKPLDPAQKFLLTINSDGTGKVRLEDGKEATFEWEYEDRNLLLVHQEPHATKLSVDVLEVGAVTQTYLNTRIAGVFLLPTADVDFKRQ